MLYLLPSVRSSSPPPVRTTLPSPSSTLAAQFTMQADEGPALELSDIMHPMSPSLAPAPLPIEPQVLGLPQVQLELPQHSKHTSEHSQAGAAATRIDHTQDPARTTPEPLDQADLQSMRQRVLQLEAAGNATPVERELASMVRGPPTSPPSCLLCKS